MYVLQDHILCYIVNPGDSVIHLSSYILENYTPFIIPITVFFIFDPFVKGSTTVMDILRKQREDFIKIKMQQLMYLLGRPSFM